MTAEWQAAVNDGSTARLEQLLAAGADIDARDRFGQTGLMLAAHRGDVRVVEWLATRGAALDHTAKYGMSAVMLAALGGHAETVRVLVGAGARLDLRASGAFAGQTVRDLAQARASAAVIDALGPSTPPAPRQPRAAFVVVDSWDAAAALVTFVPRVPRDLGERSPDRLRVFVRDYRGRELAPDERTLDAHFGDLSFSQSRHSPQEARRRALDVSYGRHGVAAIVAGRDGRAYAAGPPVPADDPDGRSPAVLVWVDGEMLYLLASASASAEELCIIGASIYTPLPPASSR